MTATQKRMPEEHASNSSKRARRDVSSPKHDYGPDSNSNSDSDSTSKPKTQDTRRKAEEEATTALSTEKHAAYGATPFLRKTEEDFQSRILLQQKQWREQPWRHLNYNRITRQRTARDTWEWSTDFPDYLHPKQNCCHLKIRNSFDFASLPLDVAAMIAMSMGIVDLSSLLQTCRSLYVHLKPILDRRKRSTAELIDAVFAFNIIDVKRSLDNGADPDVHRLGTPLLHIALGHSSNMAMEHSLNQVAANIVSLLLRSGCDPNSTDRIAQTALWKVGVPYQLRNYNDDWDGRDSQNSNSTFVADEQNDIAYQNMVDLLDAGADPNHTLSGNRLIGEWMHLPSFLSLLLKSGCSPNSLSHGSTLLCHAVDDGDIEAVQTLLEAGADPNVLTSYDITSRIKRVPLLHRALNESMDIGLKLLQSRHIICNPNVRNAAGYTALYEAAVDGDIADVKLLLAHGADPNIATDMLRWTPLHVATYMDDKPLVELLCDYSPYHRIDLNKQDETGSTALHMAVRYRHRKIRDLLYKAGVDSRVEDFIGLKPSSYHFKRNIAAFNSIVHYDIDVFGQRILCLAEETEGMGPFYSARPLVCGGGETKRQCCNGVAYKNKGYRVFDVGAYGGSSLWNPSLSLDGCGVRTIFPYVNQFQVFSVVE